MLNGSAINSGSILGIAIAAMVAAPNPINDSPINSNPLVHVSKQAQGSLKAFSGSINNETINSVKLLGFGKHIVNNAAKAPDGFINANAINTTAINIGGTPPPAVFVPPVPLPTTTINSLPLNSTRLLIDVAYSNKPRQIAPQTIGGSMIFATMPKPATKRFVAWFNAYNKSLIHPVAEPYQLSKGYRIQATNDVGDTLSLPLSSMSINSSLDGVERVAETVPRYVIGGIAQIIGGIPKLSYGTVASYDVNVFNMVKEQINIYTPYSADTAAWLGSSQGLVIDVIEIVTLSDGSTTERIKNTMNANIVTTYDIGVHSSTLTIRGENRYRHPTWWSLEYQVDYDFNSSYGVVSWKSPHVIEYSAGADEPILVNAYNISGGKARCQALQAPSMLAIGALVDGLRIVVDSIQESYSEGSTTISFAGTIA